MKPCIATAWNLWFMGIGMRVAGVCFLGCSAVMWFLMGPKALA